MIRAGLAGAAVLLASVSGIRLQASDPDEAATRARPSQTYEDLNAPYDGLYHFVRVRYGGGEGARGFRRRARAQWSHDYPRAERNFLQIITETTFVSALTEGSNVLALDDPELFKFPLAYIVEPGFWHPTDEEVHALGQYLEKGGFLIVDDFRGPYELDNLEQQLRRVLPDANMVLVDDTNAIFDSFFRVVPERVIPPYGGQPPIWYGIYEDNDPSRRLQVIINHNNDIAEYWEYSDYGYYPIDLANEAYKLGVNYVVYALTH
ncbi:MAG TPA: DUF4159 domain-containing protein [Longimicrobiales bacterium]|nr:DUF4159 domain-containing protein [Longimicrobiales bacterium]